MKLGQAARPAEAARHRHPGRRAGPRPVVDDDLVYDLWYPDRDADGYGDPAGPATMSCAPQPNASLSQDDCDDRDAARNPGATEVCDGVDQDCDGLVDDDDPTVDPLSQTTWYGDGDDDGYGAPGDAVNACERPEDFVVNADDCDDENPALALVVEWYLDGDGVGNGVPGGASCAAPSPGHAPETQGTDCDDLDPAVFPGAVEICEDGIDQNCTGSDPPCRTLVSGSLADADVIVQGEVTPDYVGWSLDPAGDFDCDGVPDLLVGAPFSGGGTDYPGAALVLSGVTLEPGVWGASLAILRLDGPRQTRAGYDVAGIGDVDRHGCDDVLVGSSDALGGEGSYSGSCLRSRARHGSCTEAGAASSTSTPTRTSRSWARCRQTSPARWSQGSGMSMAITFRT